METINDRIRIIDTYVTPKEIKYLNDQFITKQMDTSINIITGPSVIEKIKYLKQYNLKFKEFNIKLNFGCKNQKIEDFILRLPLIDNLLKNKIKVDFKIDNLFIVFNFDESDTYVTDIKNKIGSIFNETNLVFINIDKNENFDVESEENTINEVVNKIKLTVKYEKIDENK